MQAYSNPERASNPYALPDVEVFQLTAQEAASQDEDLIWEYMMRKEFRDRDAMLDAMVEEEGITGGWYWWTCLPGCVPDSSAFGPFDTQAEALADAQENADEFTNEDEDEDEDEFTNEDA